MRPSHAGMSLPQNPSHARSASARCQARCRSQTASVSPAATSCSTANSRMVSSIVTRAPLRASSSATTRDLSTRPSTSSSTRAAGRSSPEQIASTASMPAPPANTPRRRKTRCSSSSRWSWLHEIVVRSVWCRAGRSGELASRTSSGRASRRSRSAGCSRRMRPAASSSARGNPSSRRAISAIASTFAGSSRKLGCTRWMRSTSSCTAGDVPTASIDVCSTGSGTASGSRGNSCSQRSRSGCRLVTTSCTASVAVRICASSPAASMRCSKLSTTSSTGWSCSTVVIASISVRSPASEMPSAAAIVGSASSAARTPVRSA